MILGLYKAAKGPAVGNSLQCLAVADQLAAWLHFGFSVNIALRLILRLYKPAKGPAIAGNSVT